MPLAPDDARRHLVTPDTSVYAAADVMSDLLDLAARTLLMGGRLVYLLPVARKTYSDEVVPAHPCLAVVANSEEQLTSHYSRRLVTMEKVREYDPRDEAEYAAARAAWAVTSADALSKLLQCIQEANRAQAAASAGAAAVRRGAGAGGPMGKGRIRSRLFKVDRFCGTPSGVICLRHNNQVGDLAIDQRRVGNAPFDRLDVGDMMKRMGI